MKNTKLCGLFFLTCFFLNPLARADSIKTIQTENFSIHFSSEYLEWAKYTANELENIHQFLVEHDYKMLDEKVQVVIQDPFNRANGLAVPFSHSPVMYFHATSPQSDSILSNMNDWQQLLLLHEYIHLLHLAQKSRDPFDRKLGKIWELYDLYTIPIRQTWVNEGYATLLESELTGRGRLYANQASALIKQLAREGRLPDYAALTANKKGYRSGHHPYLIGSRFLNWLQQKFGKQALTNVWQRLRAYKSRSFEEAFKGVFEESASDLYARFRAEVTQQTLNEDAKRSKDISQLWQPLDYSAKAPVISPNKQQLAIVEVNQNSENKLIIYSMEENTKAKEKFNKKMEKLLKRDPLDIASKPPKIFKRKKLYELKNYRIKNMANPRWLNNETLLFVSSSLDKDWHNDIMQWHIPSGRLKQITHKANFRRFDIVDEGKAIIAEENRYGASRLVYYNLNTQKIQPLTPSSIKNLYDFPRISPNGKQLLYLYHTSNQLWQLKLINFDMEKSFDSQNIKSIPMPQEYQFVSYPSWSADGQSIYFVAGLRGDLNIFQYQINSEQLYQLTDGQFPASWPISVEEQLLFLRESSKGVNLYSLDLKQVKKLVTATTVSTAPVKKLSNTIILSKQQSDLIKEDKLISDSVTDYGIGKQKVSFTLGNTYSSASTNLLELGVSSGDLLQKLMGQLQVGISSNQVIKGFNGNIQWNDSLLNLALDIYDYTLRPQEQKNIMDFESQKNQGVVINANKKYLGNLWNLGFVKEKSNNQNRNYGILGFQYNPKYPGNFENFVGKLKVDYFSGEQENKDWDGVNAKLNIATKIRTYDIQLGYQFVERNNREIAPLLFLGGFSSGILSPSIQHDQLIEPALGFATKISNRYHRYSLLFKNNLFYRRHKIQNEESINVYGLQFKQKIPTEVIKNLNVDFGIAYVDTKEQSSDTAIWLSFSYRK